MSEACRVKLPYSEAQRCVEAPRSDRFFSSSLCHQPSHASTPTRQVAHHNINVDCATLQRSYRLFAKPQRRKPTYLLYVKGVSSSSGYVRYLHKNTYRPTGKLKHQVSPASATICSSIWITNFKPLMARIAIFGLRQT